MFVVSCVSLTLPSIADCLELCWTVVPPLPQLINRSGSLLSEINVRRQASDPGLGTAQNSTGELVLCPPPDRLSSSGHRFPYAHTHSVAHPGPRHHQQTIEWKAGKSRSM